MEMAMVDQSCIVFNFYIKSQPCYRVGLLHVGCIVFNFYIKSQPSCDGFSLGIVV